MPGKLRLNATVVVLFLASLLGQAPESSFPLNGFQVEVWIENKTDRSWQGRLTTAQDERDWGDPVTLSQGDRDTHFPTGSGEFPFMVEAQATQKLTFRGFDFTHSGFLMIESDLGDCCQGIEIAFSYRILNQETHLMAGGGHSHLWEFPHDPGEAPNLGLGWNLEGEPFERWLRLGLMRSDGTQQTRRIRLNRAF